MQLPHSAKLRPAAQMKVGPQSVVCNLTGTKEQQATQGSAEGKLQKSPALVSSDYDDDDDDDDVNNEWLEVDIRKISRK
jgi:hypothetical protein